MFAKERAKRFMKISTYIIGILILLMVVILPVFKGIYENTQKSAVNNITDTTVLDYEAYSAGLSNLLLLYGIHDDVSYKEAMANCNISDSLWASFFTSPDYTGVVTEAPVVNILTTEYEISDDVSTRLYYCVLEVNQSGVYKYYKIIAEIKENTLLDFRVLGVE